MTDNIIKESYLIAHLEEEKTSQSDHNLTKKDQI
jgi:hypothetical protein